MNLVKNFLFVLITAALLYSCSPADGNRTGHEYMPDMAHSVAYEANVYNYYRYNTWDESSTIKLKELSQPREPVAGTVPRGYAGLHFETDADLKAEMMDDILQGENGQSQVGGWINGSVPYFYEDTEEERARAIEEIIANPFPISEDGLARGKELYDVFCAICHGEKGDGLGYLANPDENPNSKYQAAPANLISDEFINSSNGRYYHSIMYGKNVMGGYSDKLSFEERWQVIHHIRTLQAKAKDQEYSADANTLNSLYGIPASQLQRRADLEAETSLEGSHSDDGSHASDHGDGH